MSLSRVLVVAVSMALLLVLPRPASAELWDFLWSFSPTSMIGPVSHCKIDLAVNTHGEKRLCYNSTLFAIPLRPRSIGPRRIWLNAFGAAYFSVRHNDPEGRSAFVFAVEPMVEVRTLTFDDGSIFLFHSAGGGWQRFVGSRFRPFDRYLVKLRPVGLSWGRFEAAFNVRIYPTEFAYSDFGFGPAAPDDRPNEIVYGLNIGFHPY